MPNFPVSMPGSQPDMQPQQPQSGLKQAMPQMVQAAIAMLAAKQAGPQAAAAFLAGMQQSKARAQQQQRQGVLDQSTLQTQQAQRDNLANDNRLADQRFGLEQVTSAQKALDPFIQQTADSATDPVEAENAVMQRATGLSSAMGLPPDRLSGLVPNMAPILSARDKKNAKTVVENIDKNPLYAGYLKTPEGQQQLDAMNVQWKGGTTKLGKLRELAGGQLKNDAGEALAPKPAAKDNPVNAGSFEDYTIRYAKDHGKTLDALTSADLEDARKRYMQADDRPPRITVNTGGAGQPATAGDWTLEGDAFLDTIPAEWRKTVKKIANYDEDPTKVASMRGGMRETLMKWANQVNPAYDASKFSIRAPTRKAYTTGTQGQQIVAMNTAIGHIDQLQGVAEALGNGTFKPGNAIWNSVKTTFGKNAPTNFDTLKDALSGEVASVLAKGGATVSGIADAKEKISSSNSPEQLAGYVKTLIPVMGSKLNELNYAYHQAMGEGDSFQALSPESTAILTKLGFDPAHPTVAGSGGAQGGGGTPSYQEYLRSRGGK